MRLLVGTSGYSYKEWKGGFYPENSKPDTWLRFYARNLQTVEINNTFYRMPSRKVLSAWAAEVPESFCFVIKASRRITHFKRLKDVEGELAYLYDNLDLLGRHLGPVLFQLPPNLPKDLPRLQEFLMQLPPGKRAVLQFGDASWFHQDVFEVLRTENVAFCLTDEEKKQTPLVATANWGYLRLRKDAYTRGQLRDWGKRIRELGWGDVFVFFKHEESAPRLALDFLEECCGGGTRPRPETT